MTSTAKRPLSPPAKNERIVKQKSDSNENICGDSTRNSVVNGITDGSVMPGDGLPLLTVNALVKNQITSIDLSSYKGNWLCIVFYPYDFQESNSSALIRECCKKSQDFSAINCAVLFCSTDSCFAHLAWSTSGVLGKVCHPMLADSDRALSSQLGLLDKNKGTAVRSVIIADPQLIIRQVLLTTEGHGQTVDSLLDVVQKLQQ